MKTQTEASKPMSVTQGRYGLDDALANEDEEAIWRIVDQHANNEAILETLVDAVARIAYERAGVPVYNEMFALPVIADASCPLVERAGTWNCARAQITHAVSSWFTPPGRTQVFNGLIPMDWITTWNPAMLRLHLKKILPDQATAQARFHTQAIDLPRNAPRLAFVLMVRTTIKSWPGLPATSTPMDLRLKDVVRYALQLAAQANGAENAKAPVVIPPDRLQHALTDGVNLWLHQLNQTVGIQGWTVMPSVNHRDVVKVSLKLDDTEVPWTQFVLRLHQIGASGLNEITSWLAGSAPMLDQQPYWRHATEQIAAITRPPH